MSNTLKYELQLSTEGAKKQFDDFVDSGKKKVAEMEKSAQKTASQLAASKQVDAKAQKQILDDIDRMDKKLHKDRLTNTKLEAKERDDLYQAYKRQMMDIAKQSPNQSAEATKKQLDELNYQYELEKKLREQTTANNIKEKTKEQRRLEAIDKKQYQAKRSIETAENKAYAIDMDKRREITKSAYAKIGEIIANKSGKTTEQVKREIQDVVDETKKKLAQLEMEAEKKKGAGFGSFTNNMFQVGQAVEDFNVGFQLNGWLGGLRGASNNVALLLSQLDGTTGVMAQLGFTAVMTATQIAIFANDTEGAADASDEFSNSLIELRFGFQQLTDEALNYRKEVISAITDTAMEGLEPFIDTMDALEAKQKLVFKTEDAKQYADEIGRTATKLKELVRAEKDMQLARQKEMMIQLNAPEGESIEDTKERWEEMDAIIAKAQDALLTKQQEYMRLAKELDLPELSAQLKEYAELEELLAQSTVDAVEEKRARYEELRQTMLETFEKARKETAKQAEEEMQRANLIENTTELIRTQAEAIGELRESEAGRNAEQQLEELGVKAKVKERELLRTLLALQDELNHTEGDERKKIQQAIVRIQGEIVDLYDNHLNQVEQIVDKEQDRLDALSKMNRAVDEAIDAGKDRLSQVKQELRDEEQKLETYNKQLTVLKEQMHTHALTTKMGMIGGQETLMNTEADSVIQNIQNQAEAHKKWVQAQVEAQNQLAGAFGGVGVNADAYLQYVDAKAEYLINQVKAKQKEYTFLFNKQREEELQKETQFQLQLSQTAGTPEEKLAAIDRAIKAQEELRQLQMSQVGEGGQFGMDKLKQYAQSSEVIQQLYLKQAMVLKEASAEAEKQKLIKKEEAAMLEQQLLRLDEIKKALADKDIIKDIDVARAKEIEASMLVIANAMQATGVGNAAFSIQQLGGQLGLPGFANGGVFDGSSPMIVGEKGPEIIFPQQGGLVLTNQESQRLLASMWASQSFGSSHTSNVSTNIGTVNIQGPPVSSGNNLVTQLRNSRYAARARKR